MKVVFEVYLDTDPDQEEAIVQALSDLCENDILTNAINGAMEAQDLDAEVTLIDIEFEPV